MSAKKNTYPETITLHSDFVAEYNMDDEAYNLTIVAECDREQRYVRADLHQAALDALEDSLKLIDQLLDDRERRSVCEFGPITVKGAEVVLVGDFLEVVGGAASG